MALHYQITVQEYLEESWSAYFDGLTITHARAAPRRWPERSGIRPRSMASSRSCVTWG